MSTREPVKPFLHRIPGVLVGLVGGILVGLFVGGALGCANGQAEFRGLMAMGGATVGAGICGIVGAIAVPIGRRRQRQQKRALEDGATRPRVDPNL